MRLAISAAAGVSGLFLLGLAFYGQPAVYLREVGQQWDALMDRPAADQAADEDSDRAARLQAEVSRLQAELAARQPAPRQADGSGAPAVTDIAPAPGAPSPVGGVAQTPPTMVVPASPDGAPAVARAKAELAKADQAKADQAKDEQAKAEQTKAEQARVEQAKAERAKAEQAKADQTRADQARADQARAEQAKAAQARLEQARADQARAEEAIAAQGRADQAKTEQARVERTRIERAKAEQARAEPAKPEPGTQAPARVAVGQPPPPPLPLPPRQEAEDAQSVLARLRQLAPEQGPEAPAAVAEARPRPASPSLPRLGAARSALASGRIEDARRLLQEVQLQLVFGPIGDSTPSAGKGSADVAHALDALSANDISLGRRYVDIAVADLSGNPSGPPVQEAGRRPAGYAPAYPPR
jgi:hypothetical protein